MPITLINCLGINFSIAHTSVTQTKCLRIICVVISGLIVQFHLVIPRRILLARGAMTVTQTNPRTH